MNIAATFEDAGCETFQAASSMDAIKRLMSNDRVDVVFTDIQMPGTMDGLALANYVQEHWPDMYIIVSSGFHLPDRRALPRNSHFVAKPVRQDRLTESPMTSARERLTIEFADATIARHGGFTGDRRVSRLTSCLACLSSQDSTRWTRRGGTLAGTQSSLRTNSA